jgi:phosphoadenylyl-sulfate reductase (thioredoxin)
MDSADQVQALVDGLDFAQKVGRALGLLEAARDAHGPGLVVAHSLGKDSCVTWDLAMRVDPTIHGFIVTTRYKPPETVAFMGEVVARYPQLVVYRSDTDIPDHLPRTDPDRCCAVLKVEPTRRALHELGATCWATGLRCTEGPGRAGYAELEHHDRELAKLNPILVWHEREVWQYLAVRQVPVNPLYARGYRSLGCAPCTRVTAGPDERAGRWQGTGKCGGECGIHTRALKGAGGSAGDV